MGEKCNLVPMPKQIIVKRDDADEMTKGGIVIPDVSKNKPERGRVVAIGEGITSGIKDGDRVIFSRYGGNEVSVNGDTYLIIKDDALLAKIV